MSEAKAFRTFIRIYYQFKSERLSANIKLTLHKALIRLVMIYTRPAWELAAHTYPLQLRPCKTKYSAPLEIVHCVHRSTICIRLCNKIV
jgi:hypothetical protein